MLKATVRGEVVGEPFGLVVRFRLKEGAGSGFDQLVRETVEQIRAAEPGTLLYACHKVPAEPASRIFYELYRDRVAFDDHEAQAHTRRFLAERDRYVASLDVTFLSLVGAKGINHPDHTH